MACLKDRLQDAYPSQCCHGAMPNGAIIDSETKKIIYSTEFLVNKMGKLFILYKLHISNMQIMLLANCNRQLH